MRTLASRLAVVSLCLLSGAPHDVEVDAQPRNGATTTVSAIDRRALVARHRVVLRRADPRTPLTVGNGTLGFTVDITGLQSFEEAHVAATPLATLSTWGWHTTPATPRPQLEDSLLRHRVGTREVPYADANDRAGRPFPAAAWLRANPHRLDLARLGLVLLRADGAPAALADLSAVEQSLDLWTGLITSVFEIDGAQVRVETAVHPERDLIAVRITSALIGHGRLRVRLAFPFPSGTWDKTADWSRPAAHTTVARIDAARATFDRTVDETRYGAVLRWSGGATLRQDDGHAFTLGRSPDRAGRLDRLDLTLALSAASSDTAMPQSVDDTRRASAAGWASYWEDGGAIDLSGSTDPRWRELERRIVLSQFLTRLHSAGPMPPQETGLVSNSWFGKAHLEMFWWHGAHFALWGRDRLLARGLDWYAGILERARETARSQGYAGARWPKMVGPDGRESPSGVGAYLAWQQPHPIYLAELLRRAGEDAGVLQRYADIVFASAEFMASFPVEGADGRLHLGPPLIPAQETYGRMRDRVQDPTFELAYWRWALGVAQEWRTRLGLPREPTWDAVRDRLVEPQPLAGRYPAMAVAPFTTPTDHPSMLMAFGFLPPTRGIDREVMQRTFDWVRAHWEWQSTWGWDYPVLAMTAARLGRPRDALDALLLDVPKNQWLANGHTPQRANLPVYLPSNGGLLAAVAMMAAGWDGAPSRHAPGFPDDGTWVVRSEGLRPLP